MSQISISVEKLSYWYGDLKAVNGISFEVGQGEILGFLGPNGAGKTTTQKMLTGQLKPKDGRATLLGFDVAKDTEEIHRRIGICFEQTNLYEQMTALENLQLFADLFGVKNFDGYALLKRVGLAGREKDKVAGYSKGMKQRLMIARSLVNTPSILFMDEPTSGLDPVSSESIRDIILEERKRGATIFLTTHDMWEADKLCDRVAFINEGSIAALDTPVNLKQQYGKRSLVAKIKTPDGKLENREIALDTGKTSAEVSKLLDSEQVLTLHSEEATLEDIFIKITGRRLTE
ncbi:MAG: ABC transporter ATP-binding protein [Dehalococcoides mccartyi]|uniref:ABC transporter ATP-binding protein n=1 Tax=Dehalococcoides TaxID=61434 RepID=UPI0004E0373C|nr:ABC transporter ATP-binding protein [Dehalococcoides mccartyi]AII58891.1 multidrug ABC transporter ATP-binding protein [Dehalococcoides mccartyi CG4]MBF4483128.1 ABC transporter ATP-binding protein [Dehalococcoides mccartyi]MBJ7531455.1 ABC transporter ATP-binding protein [Dehalococcoides mccartyi]MDN4186224.1 ABC transporter ATP-binding protein [Dehalococcoides mccartyi]MDP4279386.1 ABC transporter ATP-binding protein [Dehalococcoides mccartyi]